MEPLGTSCLVHHARREHETKENPEYTLEIRLVSPFEVELLYVFVPLEAKCVEQTRSAGAPNPMVHYKTACMGQREQYGPQLQLGKTSTTAIPFHRPKAMRD